MSLQSHCQMYQKIHFDQIEEIEERITSTLLLVVIAGLENYPVLFVLICAFFSFQGFLLIFVWNILHLVASIKLSFILTYLSFLKSMV